MNGQGRLRGYSFLLILSIETNHSRFTRPYMKVRIASLLPNKHIQDLSIINTIYPSEWN